jgi:protein-tyrosine phosphatase
VHCSAGKDRTGIVVALVLAALGVPDEVIAADYALSARYLDPERTPAIRQLQDSTGLGDRPPAQAARQPARAHSQRPGPGQDDERVGWRLPA